MNPLCCFISSPAASRRDFDNQSGFKGESKWKLPGLLSFLVHREQRYGRLPRRKGVTSSIIVGHGSQCRSSSRSLKSPSGRYAYQAVHNYLHGCDDAAVLLSVLPGPRPTSHPGSTTDGTEVANELNTDMSGGGIDLGLTLPRTPWPEGGSSIEPAGDPAGGARNSKLSTGMHLEQGSCRRSNVQQQQQQEQRSCKLDIVSTYPGCQTVRLLVQEINQAARELFNCTTPADYEVLLAELLVSEPHLAAALRESCISAMDSRSSSLPPRPPPSPPAGVGASCPEPGGGGGRGVNTGRGRSSEARTVLVTKHPRCRPKAQCPSDGVQSAAVDLVLQVTLQPLLPASVPAVQQDDKLRAPMMATAAGSAMMPGEGAGAGQVLRLVLRYSPPLATPPKDPSLGHLQRSYAALAALPGLVTMLSYDGRQVLFQNAASLEFMGLRCPAAVTSPPVAAAARPGFMALDMLGTGASVLGAGMSQGETVAAAAPAMSSAAAPMMTSASLYTFELSSNGAIGGSGLDAGRFIEPRLVETLDGCMAGRVRAHRRYGAIASDGRAMRVGDGGAGGGNMGDGATAGSMNRIEGADGTGGGTDVRGVLVELFKMAPEGQLEELLCQVSAGQTWRGIIPVPSRLTPDAPMHEPWVTPCNARESATAAVAASGGDGGGSALVQNNSTLAVAAAAAEVPATEAPVTEAPCFQFDQPGLMSSGSRPATGSVLGFSEEALQDSHTNEANVRSCALDTFTSGTSASPVPCSRPHIKSPSRSRGLLPPATPLQAFRPHHITQPSTNSPRLRGGVAPAEASATAPEASASSIVPVLPVCRPGLRWPSLSLLYRRFGGDSGGGGRCPTGSGDGAGATASGGTCGLSAASVSSSAAPPEAPRAVRCRPSLSADRSNCSFLRLTAGCPGADAGFCSTTAAVAASHGGCGNGNGHNEVVSAPSTIYLSTTESLRIVSNARPPSGNATAGTAIAAASMATGPTAVKLCPATATAISLAPQQQQSATPAAAANANADMSSFSTSAASVAKPTWAQLGASEITSTSALPAAAVDNSIPVSGKAQTHSTQTSASAVVTAATAIPRRTALSTLGGGRLSYSLDAPSKSLQTSTWGHLDTMRWIEKRKSFWQQPAAPSLQLQAAAAAAAAATIAATAAGSPAVGSQQEASLSTVGFEGSFSGSYAPSHQEALAGDTSAASKTLGHLIDPEPWGTLSSGGDGIAATGGDGAYAATVGGDVGGICSRAPVPSVSGSFTLSPLVSTTGAQSSTNRGRAQRRAHRPPAARFLALVAAAAASTSSRPCGPSSSHVSCRAKSCTEFRNTFAGQAGRAGLCTAQRCSAVMALDEVNSGQHLPVGRQSAVDMYSCKARIPVEASSRDGCSRTIASPVDAAELRGVKEGSGIAACRILGQAEPPPPPSQLPQSLLPGPSAPARVAVAVPGVATAVSTAAALPALMPAPTLEPFSQNHDDRTAAVVPSVSSGGDDRGDAFGSGSGMHSTNAVLQYIVTNVARGRGRARQGPLESCESVPSTSITAPSIEATLGIGIPSPIIDQNAELKLFNPPSPPQPPLSIFDLPRGATDVEAAAEAGETSCIGRSAAAAAASAAAATAESAAAAIAAAPAAAVHAASPVASPAAAASTDALDSCCWHEVTVTRLQDPVSGQPALLITQWDITARVRAERLIAEVQETEHRLLESIFPRHVLEVAAAASFGGSTANSPTARQLQGARPSGSGGVGTHSDGKRGRRRSVRRPLTATRQGRPSGRTSTANANVYGSLMQVPLAANCSSLATYHPMVTILFADIVGFTEMCHSVQPSIVMQFLNQLYSRLDSLLDVYGVYKVETIGDCYMVAGGLMTRDAEGFTAVRRPSSADELHAAKVLAFAKAMLREASTVPLPTTGHAVRMRIGLHSGPVMSGIVGAKMPRFCLFGDTVNTASRMESTCKPGCIHVSAATRGCLSRESDEDMDGHWRPTGGVQVKGKGQMQTFLWRPRFLSGPVVPSVGALRWGLGTAAGAPSTLVAAAGLPNGGSDGGDGGGGSAHPLSTCGNAAATPLKRMQQYYYLKYNTRRGAAQGGRRGGQGSATVASTGSAVEGRGGRGLIMSYLAALPGGGGDHRSGPLPWCQHGAADAAVSSSLCKLQSGGAAQPWGEGRMAVDEDDDKAGYTNMAARIH